MKKGRDDRARQARYSNRLQKLKEEVQHQLQRAQQAVRDAKTQNGDDWLDETQRHQERELSASDANRARHTLVSVDQALMALKRGSYGLCQGCGDPIPEKRLTALPFAARCVPCQEEVEMHRSHSMTSAYL